MTLESCDTWDLICFIEGRKAIGCKWVYKKKFGANNSLEKYKARLVVKGYSHREGVDFGEIFSHVAKLSSIRLILSIIVSNDFEIEKMDVKIAFLHGDLEEEIYMQQPKGLR